MGSVIWMKQVRLLSSTWSKVMARSHRPNILPALSVISASRLGFGYPNHTSGMLGLRTGITPMPDILPALILFALVAELVDARVSRTRAFGHAGSSPALGTIVL
jgi:hypothetical protein